MKMKDAQRIAHDPHDVRGPVPLRKVIPHKGTNLHLRTFLQPDGHPIVERNIYTPPPTNGATTIPTDIPMPGMTFNGLGDHLAAVTKKLGIEPCEGCDQRRQKLNTMFPAKMDNKK